MTKIARHLLHHPSNVDDTQPPFIVCAPAELPASGSLPTVLLLHDVLDDPSSAGFVEEGFRLASEWLNIVAENIPSILAIPFGRGNGGWLGAGGNDLFVMLDELRRQFPIDESAISLLGIGAGGTGALQLAGWFPDRFAAVAAIGAWTDPSLDIPLGSAQWPEWEQTQRNAMAPIAIVSNLRNTPIHLEHPWYFQGIGSTAGRTHFERMKSRCIDEGITVRTAEASGLMAFEKKAPVQRASLYEWLIAQKRNAQPESVEFSFESASWRASECQRVHIHRFAKPGKTARLEGSISSKGYRLKTKRIEALTVQWLDGEARKIRIDDSRFEFLETAAGWTQFEKLGSEWQATETGADARWLVPPRDGRLKSAGSSGPMFDLRWNGTIVVPGSLGDEADIEANTSFANSLAQRWQQGADSIQPHPGDRTVAADIPVVLDSALSDQQQVERNVILIGRPQTNLVLARLGDRLPMQWSDESTGSSFRLNGKRYDDPADAVMILYPNPEAPRRYLLVISSNSPAGLAAASRIETAWLPDFIVFNQSQVLDWGYFGSDWQLGSK